MNLNIPGNSMASAALAISQGSNGKCGRCNRAGVAVVTQTGLCQSCSTKAEAAAMGLTPALPTHTPMGVKVFPGA